MGQKLTVSNDDFEAWRDHPVTRWLLTAFGSQAEAIKEGWEQAAWHNDQLDPIDKTRAHARWDILDALSTLSYEDACEYAGEKPEGEEEKEA